jgi:hypothetical protein
VNRKEPRLPAAPIIEAIASYCRRYRTTPYRLLTPRRHRAYVRARVTGDLTWRSGERLADAAGYHPAEVWGWDTYYRGGCDGGEVA